MEELLKILEYESSSFPESLSYLFSNMDAVVGKGSESNLETGIGT
jgi:hypothetical protein